VTAYGIALTFFWATALWCVGSAFVWHEEPVWLIIVSWLVFVSCLLTTAQLRESADEEGERGAFYVFAGLTGLYIIFVVLVGLSVVVSLIFVLVGLLG
jgi:hypothetical protein